MAVDVSNLIRLELSLYAIMLLGYILCRKGFIRPEAEAFLSKLALDIILPCSIIRSFLITMSMDLLRQFAIVLAGGLAVTFIQLAAGFLAFRFLPAEQEKVMKYSMINANNAFLGYPVIEGMYGTAGLTQSSVYMIPVRIGIWTIGLSLFAGDGMRGRQLLKKCLLHPAMIGMYIGVFFMVTQLPMPGFLTDSIRMMAGCLSPVSMLLIGAILTRVPLRQVLSWKCLYCCLVRLVLIPGVVLLGFLALGIGGLPRNVCVLMAAMPCASITAVLASQYRSDEKTAGIIVTLSTLLSTLTIPAWGALLNLL